MSNLIMRWSVSCFLAAAALPGGASSVARAVAAAVEDSATADGPLLAGETTVLDPGLIFKLVEVGPDGVRELPDDSEGTVAQRARPKEVQAKIDAGAEGRYDRSRRE